MTCDEAAPLLHALVDGELDAVHARDVETHAAGCARCAAALAALRDMRQAFAQAQLRMTAPGELRRRIEATLPAPRGETTSRRSLLKGFALGAGLSTAIAATLLVAVMRSDEDKRLTSEVVTAHLRSLQGDHLTDVQSSDQHTVKPWFNGRIDISPPVVDLTALGFTLIGGRLDYVDGKPVAVLVYRRRNHVINLFVSPETEMQRRTGVERVQGFNLRRWTASGLGFSAVSDLNGEELQEFVDRFAAGARDAS